MTSSFSSPMEAFILTLIVILGAVLFLITIVLLVSLGEHSRRKDVFHKLSKEYGLSVEIKKYSLNSTVVPFKLYSLLRMVGTIQGHTVCIEDLRSFHFGGTRWFVFFLSSIGTAATRMNLHTEMTLDGIKHTISHSTILPLNDNRSSFRKIKEELDKII